MLKAIANYFTNAGWLLLPPSFMAYDKQQHGILAVFLTIVSFFPSIGILGKGILMSMLISFLFNTIIAWAIEYYQKYFMPNREFDPKDALVMMAVNVILLAIFSIRVYLVGTAQW